ARARASSAVARARLARYGRGSIVNSTVPAATSLPSRERIAVVGPDTRGQTSTRWISSTLPLSSSAGRTSRSSAATTWTAGGGGACCGALAALLWPAAAPTALRGGSRRRG